MSNRMKTSLIATAATLAALSAASQAAAQERWPNWYVGLHAGVNFYPDSDVSVGAASAELKTDTGFMGGASLGYMPNAPHSPFLNALRFEIEYTYRQNDNNSVGGAVITSDTKSHAGMFNILYDVDTQTSWVPYFGGGIGMANIEFENGAGIVVDDNVFAWQLMVGLGYTPTVTMPNTVWSVGYRYFATEDAEFTLGGVRGEIEYSAHSIEAGAKFRF